MKLIACHVDNFGKLSDFHMDFTDGVNVINEPNGWGKSTLTAFIKSMLYGFDNKKEPGAFELERKIYQPWQGGVYGGQLDFSVGDKKYRISRIFGKSEKGDKFRLYDLSTNKLCKDYSAAIGQEIFDIDRNSFKRSIFIAQNDCTCETSDEINTKLGNLAENTDDINNFESAIKLIRGQMDHISPNRLTGSAKRRRNTITQLEEELDSYDRTEESMAELLAKLEEKKSQKKELTGIRQEYAKALQIASEDSRRQELKRTYKALCEDVTEKDCVCQSYGKYFSGHIPDEYEIDKQLGNARRLEGQRIQAEGLKLTPAEEKSLQRKAKLFENQAMFEQRIEDMLSNAVNITKVQNEHRQLESKLVKMEKLAQEQVDMEETETEKKSLLFPIGAWLLGVGTIAVLAAVVLGFLAAKNHTSAVLPVIFAVPAVIFLIVGGSCFVTGRRKNRQLELEKLRRQSELELYRRERETPIAELKMQLRQIESGITILNREVEEFLDAFGCSAEPEEYYRELYQLKLDYREYEKLLERKKAYEEAQKHCEKLYAEIRSYGEELQIPFGEDPFSDLGRLQTKVAEYRVAEQNLASAEERKRSFEKAQDMEELMAPSDCPYTIEELNGLIREVDEKLEEVRRAMSHCSRQIEGLQEQLDLRDEKIVELANCRKLQEKEVRQYETLKMTQEYLQRSKEEFTARYMEPISNAFRKYYQLMSSDTSDSWVVDANISVKMREQGELRDVQCFSAGYQDLLGVCMRLALVDAMYPGEKPFLILDDPFVNLDQERLDNGKNLLDALKKEYQVIYFTCHESREYIA